MERSKTHVILSAAISLDGKISTTTGDSKLSSKQDLKRVHKLRSKVDAILVGKTTILKDDPLLNVRFVKGKNPIRVILDSTGRIPTKSKIIQTANKISTIVATTKKISKKDKSRLEKYNIETIVQGQNRVNLNSLLKKLYKRNIKKILLEGGGNTNWEFVKNGLVDELVITITPFLLGGQTATSLVEGQGFSKIVNSSKFRLTKVGKQGNELLVHYSKL